MVTRRPFTPKGSSEKNAVLSDRHHNIPFYAAIGEIIDNSIEWSASKIHIFVDYKNNKPKQPKKIIFIDNGVGMSRDALSDSLVAGFHNSDESSEHKIGRFGVGCTYAFLSNCKKSEVYSKQNGDGWFYSVFDLGNQDLDDPTKDFPHDAILKEPPVEYAGIWSKLDSGTITVWTNFDRGEVEAYPEEVPFWISRAYRKFIGQKVVNCKRINGEWESIIEDNDNPIKIYFNDELLKAYDPLYAIPFRGGDEGGILYKPIVIEYPKPDGSVSDVVVQFGLCNEKWRQYIKKSADDPINIEERHIKGRGQGIPDIENSQKIAIVRNNREVSWLTDGWLYGRSEPIDRWWGIEILYDSELDGVFNVKNMKYQVGLSSELRGKLREETKSTVKELRDEISRIFDLDKAKNKKQKREAEKEGKAEDSNIIGDLIEEDDLENATDSDDDTTDEFLKKSLDNATERKKILERLADRKFVVDDDVKKRVPKDTHLLFEYHSHGGEILMMRYMNHPWFREFQELKDGLESNAENKEEISIEMFEAYHHDVTVMWEILLQSFVISLATLSPDPIQQKAIDKLLSKWGQLSMQYVERREQKISE